MSFRLPILCQQPIGNCTIWVFAVIVILLSDSLLAQNPLRAQSTQHPSTSQQPHFTQSTRNAPNNQYQTGMIDRLSRNRQPDAELRNEYSSPNSIAQASYNSPVESESQLAKPTTDFSSLNADTTGLAEPKTKTEMNFIERDNIEAAQPQDDASADPQQNLGQLISKLGMNLAFVLFLAIGGILAAKQWMKPPQKGQSKNRFLNSEESSHSDSMQVLETLRIDGKTTLHLIECGTSKVLVATDAVGLKSINLLTPSFESTLQYQADDFEAANPQSFSRHREETIERPKPKSASPKLFREPTSPVNKPPTKPAPDAMDEKLIRMLLENSKKRQPTR